MRISVALVIVALLPLISAATADQGSLDALLDRISSRNQRALPVNAIPADLKSNLSASAPAVPNNKASPSPVSKNPKGSKVRMAKRYRQFRDGRRWIWDSSIIQDDSPSTGIPLVGQNANRLSSNAVSVNTPTVKPSAWAPPPAAAPTSIAPISVHSRDKDRVGGVAKERHQQLGHKLKKKWVWTDSIIQDGDTVPAGADHTTPASTLVAPTFPPLSPPAEVSPSSVPSLALTSSVTLSAPAEASPVSSPLSSHSLDEAAVFSAIAAANRLVLLDSSIKAAQASAATPAVKMVKREKRFREE